MKKNIWIFHHYATPPNDGGLVRPFDFGKQLIKKGYAPTIFSSHFNHYTHKSVDTEGKSFKKVVEADGIPFVYIKTKEYTTNGMDRVKNMISFLTGLFSVTKKYTKATKEKPDIIIASSPHPLTCIAGIFIAKRYKVPCIVEIRDLWPESIVAYSQKWRKKHLLIKLLYQGEKWIYKKADAIIFTMPGGSQYIKEQNWDQSINMEKVFHINNGVDLEAFDDNKEHYQIEDADLENPDIFKVIYTGSIRKANNLGMLLDAGKKLENQNIKLLIWGHGAELDGLKQRVHEENISNFVFKGGVDKQYVPYILSKADVNIFHLKSGDFMRFGMSANKSFEYLASGKPILMTTQFQYNFFIENNAGRDVENQTPEQIAKAVEEMYHLSKEEYDKMGENARHLAHDFDFKVLTQTLIDIIEGLS